VLQNACSVGREKRIILACRNDINREGLIEIIRSKGITDILSVPGKRNAQAPDIDFVKLCQQEGIKLTSIDIVKPGTPETDAIYDLVGARRPE
jgi:hypothetical protein